MKEYKTKYITVYSPQGGSGKSTLAVNLAVIYALKGYRTILAEASQFGSAATILSVPFTDAHGFEMLIDRMESGLEAEKKDEYLRECLTSHDTINNLRILLNGDPLSMSQISEKDATEIFSIMDLQKADVIVFDTSAELSLFKITLFEQSDRIVVPIKGDLASVLKLCQFRDVCRQANISQNKLDVILNMNDKRTSLNEDEIRKNCDMNVCATIPDYGIEFRKKSNEGVLAIKMNSRIKKMFLEIAEKVISF